MVEPARSKVLSLIGLDAIRSYVAVRVVRGPTLRQGDVLRERIELWTDGGNMVLFLFLRPIADDHEVGAVVAVHQHAGNYALGKSELAGLEGDPQLAFAVELAESGVPTLVAGQEDPLFPFQDVRGLVSSFRKGVADFVPFEGRHAFPAVQRRLAISWLKANLLADGSTP